MIVLKYFIGIDTETGDPVIISRFAVPKQGQPAQRVERIPSALLAVLAAYASGTAQKKPLHDPSRDLAATPE